MLLLLLAAGMARAALAPLPPCLPAVFVYDQQLVAPVQPLAELCGAALSEDIRSGEITVAYRGHTLRCTPGSRLAMQDVQQITLPFAVYRRAGVLYLPLAPLAEALGGTLRQDATTHEIVLTLPGAPPLALPRREKAGVPGEAIDHAAALFTVNLDGSGFRRLTYDGAAASLPTISHDGTTLLWASDGKLQQRALDDTREQQVGSTPLDREPAYRAPFFSGDDRRIFYDFDEILAGNYQQMVCSMALDGTDVRNIAVGLNLTVSPDGSHICFQRSQPDGANGPEQQLVLAMPDGTAPSVLGVNLPPAIFSPDSRHLLWKVVWQHFDHYMNALILATISAQGVAQQQLLQLADYDCAIHPGCFSPDSRRLVCAARGLAIYELASGTRTAVLDNVYDLAMPTFAPDGTHLVFACQRHLCSCRLDGSELRVLTPSMSFDTGSRWGYCYAPGGRVIFAAAPE